MYMERMVIIDQTAHRTSTLNIHTIRLRNGHRPHPTMALRTLGHPSTSLEVGGVAIRSSIKASKGV